MIVLPGLRGRRLRDLSALSESPLAQALDVLNRDGEETRLVGGAVRDLALGVAVDDFDLATTATPDEVVRRARAAGFKVALTGFAHGTVTLIVDGRPIETTTLREDIETDGRRAKVAFGRDFSVDARRRDFTINALSLDNHGVVHDTVGGLEDLASGRVRFIGDADARIREDYLRILRFFRFSARFARGALDADSLAAAIRNRAGMALLSRERVRAELFKLLIAPRAGEIVQSMGECGFLEPLLGGPAYPGRLRRLIAIESTRGGTADAVLRLAALGAAIVEDADRLRERLRLANGEFERVAAAVAALAGLHGVAAPPSLDDLLVLLFKVKRRAARDALALAHAKSVADPDDRAFAEADSFLALAAEPKLPFGGADLVARGVSSGRRVGEILRSLQALWIRAGFPKDPKTLGRLLDEATAEVDGESTR